MKNYAFINVLKTKGNSHGIALQNHISRTRVPKNSHENKITDNEFILGNGKTKELVDEHIKNKYDFSKKKKNKNGEWEQRKIRKDACQSINILLTASPGFFYENLGIDSTDKKLLKKWKQANLDYLQEKYKDDIVSVVLHMDETTPHIHATLVPMVELKEKSKIKKGKNQYKLCAKNFYTPQNLKILQTEYAKAMQAAGFDLHRGEEGSISEKHLSENQKLRNKKIQNEDLEREEITKKRLLNKSLKSWSNFQTLEKVSKKLKNEEETLKNKAKLEEKELAKLEDVLTSLLPKKKLKRTLKNLKKT